MSEQQLVKRIMQGETHAFDSLINPYKNYLLKVIFSFTKNTQDSEEVLQEISLKIFQSLGSFSGKSFKSWITRITINHCIDLQRKKRIQPVSLEELVENNFSGEVEIKDPAESPKDQLLTKEKDALLFQALENLPEDYRSTLKLFYFSELSNREIAQKLDVSPRTIESRIYRARKMLEESLRDYAL